jgi:integrase
MSVLAECPICHKKQSVKNKICRCGEDLDKAKRSKRINYWIDYRVPGTPPLQIRQFVGKSIEDARDADAKRRVQKAENRFLDMLPESNMTFGELADWYTSLKKVQNLAMFKVTLIHLAAFNTLFGATRVNNLSQTELEDFQAEKLEAGLSKSYVDQIIGSARSMVIKAIDDRKISANCLWPFKKAGKLLKRHANARAMVFQHDQYLSLMNNASVHLKPIIACAYWAGLRRGEILSLRRHQLDLKNRIILLEDENTKDAEPRRVPIFEPLYNLLSPIPPALHDDHIFRYRGRPIRDIRGSFKVAMQAAKIPYGRNEPGGLVFHDLRHTFATNMRRAGVPDSVIIKIMGHSTREIFDRVYNLVDDSDAIAAGKMMTGYIEQFGLLAEKREAGD